MKTIGTGLAAHLAQGCTTLATCWRIDRRDGTVLGFTDHDRDLIIAGVTYLARTGSTPSAVGSSADLAVDNLDIEGILDAEILREDDIHAGKYDHAEVSLFLVNYEDVTQGQLQLRRGWLGEVGVNKGRFVAEVRGLTQQLSQVIGELYGPLCRARLGDARCQVALATFTVNGTVTETDGRLSLADSERSEPAGYFDAGCILFTSGANEGLRMEVKSYRDGGEITLVLPMPYVIASGDAYTLEAGCDKTLATCKARFDNIVNFRGEPHVPGIDRMLETATTRGTDA